MANAQSSKPSVEELWATDFFQQHLAGAVKWALEETQNDMLSNIDNNMRDLESPLEAAFLAWWFALNIARHGASLWPWPQRKVMLGTQEYRLDFTIEPGSTGWFTSLKDHPLKPKIAIELDGHEFHERTKEQVTWRNARDRALTTHGWTVWHFSGSEFHRDPKHVVVEQIYEPAMDLYFAAHREARDGKGTVSATDSRK